MQDILKDTIPMDSKPIYCRKLGHYLQFKYCRCENNGLPCARIKRCWQEVFPIDEFLVSQFSAIEIKYIFEPPPAKITSIVELIRQAQALPE